VTTGWAVSIPLEQAGAAAPLRVEHDIEACVAGNRLWLRGTRWSESLDHSLRKILGADRFHRLADGQTADWDCTLASGYMPEGPWTLFHKWLRPTAPTIVFPAKVRKRAELHLVRTTAERAANLIVVNFKVWLDYAISAPQIRLDRLSFAVSDDGLVLVRGEPLPPLPGSRFVESGGVGLPAGWTWSPAIGPLVVRQSLNLADRHLALFSNSGEYEVIRADDFVRATRSAVRLTEQELGRVAR
jgi:hypothetical protein